MTVERHFVGWDAPAVEKVRDYLIPSPLEGPVDLRGTLVLAPTQQAQRRLREALTLHCAQRGTYLLAPMMRTPLHLVRADDDLNAGPVDVAAIWTVLLRSIDLTEFSGLFPNGVPVRDFGWALGTGGMLQSLRDELAEHGLSIQSVCSEHASSLQEPERWNDMARLESLFLASIEERCALRDPCRSMLQRARAPKLPPSVERIVLACNPDPTPIALRALDELSISLPVDILIHAPTSLADSFDAWGRPLAAQWKDVAIGAPTDDIRLASSPAAQSGIALELLAEESRSTFDIALGVPDTSIVPYVETALAARGIRTYNPAGAPVRDHPIHRLMEAYRNLADHPSYASLSGLFRNADMLDYLGRTHGIGTRTLLTELDEFRNNHLPGSVQDMADRLRDIESQGHADDYATLSHALHAATTMMENARDRPPEQSLRTFLQAVYAVRELRPGAAEDREFRAVAERVDEELRRTAGGVASMLRLTPPETMELLMQHLGRVRYALERPPDSIDLEGWLELSWNDAPLLIITGMNDGAVPQMPGNEAFLPESLRAQLGMRSESDRMARDVFLARTFMESRRCGGRVCFITGKYGQDGEPLRASRLLLQCSDTELPQRALRLFGPPDDIRPSVPSSISFKLHPWVPPSREPQIRLPSSLAATAFHEYLSCPFRFYLKRVLRMESLADTKAEMDARDFGSLMHDALARMASDADLRQSTNATVLRGYLHARAEEWVRRHFGTSPPLHLAMQLDVARERLSAVARVQADEAAQGWEIVMWEESFSLPLGIVTVKGRIDRVDRHTGTGVLRVLDYKSSEQSTSPDESHMGPPRDDSRDYALTTSGGKPRRWTDLQLPLYVRMVRSRLGDSAQVQAGYFNVPRDTDGTSVAVWPDLTEELLCSADLCATGVVRDILDRRFWPPAQKVDYDDFESIFPTGAENCVDHAAFTDFLQEWKG